MKQLVITGFIKAINNQDYLTVLQIYRQSIYSKTINESDLTQLTDNQCQQIQDTIDLLLVAFQNTSSLPIMKWLYQTLNQYLNKSIDFIVFEEEELSQFWLKTFKTAAYQGNTELVRWLFDLSLTNLFGYNLTDNDQLEIPLAKNCLLNDQSAAFRNASSQGHLATAELIYDLGFIYKWPINLHNNNQWCFYWACHNGNLKMAKWLYHKANSIANPYDNLVDIYLALLEDIDKLANDKLEVFHWLSNLPDITNNDWFLVNDNDFN